MMCHDTSANSQRIDYNGKKNDNNSSHLLSLHNSSNNDKLLLHLLLPVVHQGQPQATTKSNLRQVSSNGQVQRRQVEGARLVVVAKKVPKSTILRLQQQREQQQQWKAKTVAPGYLLLLVSLLAIQLVLATSSTVAAAADQPVTFSSNDPTCQWPNGVNDSPEAAKLVRQLLTLKCDLKPLVSTYGKLLASRYGQKALEMFDEKSGMSTETFNVWRSLANLASHIDHFYSEALYVLSRREFCTYPVVVRFAKLRDQLGSDNTLLRQMFDTLAIHYHQSCLVDAMEKLPPVPYIVREVVEIYIEGADSSFDLNKKPAVFQEDGGEEVDFDVNEAIARNGCLEDVMSLLLSSLNGPANAQVFRDKCKDFLIEIDERWQSMEMMSRMLSTEVNGIQRFNNYVMRQLIPTKYADICSRLSRASE